MSTANYGLTLPTVGADDDAWGTILNTALTAVDASMFGRISGSTAFSGTQLDIALPSQFNRYQLILAVTVNAGDTDLRARLSYDSGANYVATAAYNYDRWDSDPSGATNSGADGQTALVLTGTMYQQAGVVKTSTIDITALNVVSSVAVISARSTYIKPTSFSRVRSEFSGHYTSVTSRLTNIRIYAGDGGTINAHWALFGLPGL